MIEGRRLLAGEAILSGPATVERSQEEVLESMVREHSRLVYRIAYAVLRSHHDAEDATQETFLRVVRHRGKLAEVEDPKTWLARIAWRAAVDRTRQRGRRQEMPIDDPDRPVDVASPELPADQSLHDARLNDALERLIAALPAKLREPLILSTIEEMSRQEVAATLGIDEAAVRSRIFRARKILKERLASTFKKK